jgi:hypothetical protein
MGVSGFRKLPTEKTGRPDDAVQGKTFPKASIWTLFIAEKQSACPFNTDKSG